MSDGGKPARPAYAALDGRDGTPPGAGWTAYGREDELGSINLLTAAGVLAGARGIEAGKVFSLNWALELPAPALFGRRVVEHAIIDLDPAGTEDKYDDFYPQASSQWDGLSHIRHPRHGFYQGHDRAAITGRPGSRLGIEHWARRGIVGRFVLADLPRFRAKHGRELRCDRSEAISVGEIEACLAHQKVELEIGDILLLRFGWTGWYETTDGKTRARLAESDLFAAPGLENVEATAAWIWDRGLAAIAADNDIVLTAIGD